MVNVFLLRLIVLLIFSYGPIPESFSLFSYFWNAVVSKLLWLWLDSIVGPLMSDVRSVHLVYIDQLSRCLYTEAKESVCSWSTITQIFFLGFDLSFNYSPASLDNFRTLQVGSGMVKSQSLTTFPQQTSLTAGKLTLFTKSFSIN